MKRRYGGTEIGGLCILFFLLFCTTFASAVEISECTKIDAPGTYYLANDLTGASMEMLDDSRELLEAEVWDAAAKNYSACIQITSPNILLDCKGFHVNSEAEKENAGISIEGQGGNPGEITNVTIRNCSVSGYGYGILGIRVGNSRFTDNSLLGNDYGYLFLDSYGNNLTNNVAKDNKWRGFAFNSAENCTLENNTVIESSICFGIDNSSGFQIIGNGAFSCRGFELVGGSHMNYLEGNTAVGSGERDDRYGFDIRGHNNTIVGNTAINHMYGFNIMRGGSNSIKGNNASGSRWAFEMYETKDNEIVDNAAFNSSIGFNIFDSFGNIIAGNTAHDNEMGFSIPCYGTVVHAMKKMRRSENNTLENNTAYDNSEYGFFVEEYGFLAECASKNTFNGNTAMGNGIDMELATEPCYVPMFVLLFMVGSCLFLRKTPSTKKGRPTTRL